MSYATTLCGEFPTPPDGVRLREFLKAHTLAFDENTDYIVYSYDYRRHEAWARARLLWVCTILALLPNVPDLDPSITLSFLSKSLAAVERIPLFDYGAELSEPRHRHR